MTLTAFDIYGKPFVRGVLTDDPAPSPAVIDALDNLLGVAQASYTVADVAAELGVRITLPPPTPAAAPRTPPRAKSRAA